MASQSPNGPSSPEMESSRVLARATVIPMTGDVGWSGLPDGLWPSRLTGTDLELLLREESVIQLGAGLCALAALAEQHVAEYDKLSAADIAAQSVSARSLSPEVRELAGHRIGSIIEDFGRDWDARTAELDPNDVEEVPDPFSWAAEKFGERPDAQIAAVAAALSDLPEDASSLGYLAQYAAATGRNPRLPAMRRALLITAIASSEMIVSGILHRILFDREGGSWQSPALDKAVNDLMAGGVEKWEIRFCDQMDIDLTRVSCDWDAVKELWARRHVLVHNGGIADQKYAQRVKGAEPGMPLEVDDEYLRTAIDLICGFLLGVIYTVWAAVPDRLKFVTYRAAGHAVSMESEHRWPLAENLYAITARLDTEPDEAAASQVNAWLARMHWRGTESVAADATAWKTASLPPVFTLARMVLTGQVDDAIAVIPQLLEQGEITKDNLQAWSLFDSIRGEQAFQELLIRLDPV